MPPRIACLVPSATEALFELGLGDQVVARSHACDFPAEARALPPATRPLVVEDGTSAEIDAAVKAQGRKGEPMFEVLETTLHHTQPDVVIAQETCDVCGITPPHVGAALSRIEPEAWPAIVTLHPHTLDDVLDDIVRVAEAAGEPARGQALVARLRERLDRVHQLVEGADQRPRVAVLDWVDPPMAAGHWVPDMVRSAGGEPVLVAGPEPSRWVSWKELVDAAPDVVIVAPCGFDLARVQTEAHALAREPSWQDLPAVASGRVHGIDGDAYVSRPGPRLVDGVERFAAVLQAELVRDELGHLAGEVPRLMASVGGP